MGNHSYLDIWVPLPGKRFESGYTENRVVSAEKRTEMMNQSNQPCTDIRGERRGQSSENNKCFVLTLSRESEELNSNRPKI